MSDDFKDVDFYPKRPTKRRKGRDKRTTEEKMIPTDNMVDQGKAADFVSGGEVGAVEVTDQRKTKDLEMQERFKILLSEGLAPSEAIRKLDLQANNATSRMLLAGLLAQFSQDFALTPAAKKTLTNALVNRELIKAAATDNVDPKAIETAVKLAMKDPDLGFQKQQKVVLVNAEDLKDFLTDEVEDHFFEPAKDSNT